MAWDLADPDRETGTRPEKNDNRASHAAQCDGTYNYTYDNEGNLIQRTAITGGATRLFTYDFINRLVEVKDFPTSDTGGTPTQDIQYAYNMLNQLVSRTVYLNGSSTASAFDAYVYDGENLAIDYTLVDGTVTLSKTYLTGLAVDQVFAQEDMTKDLGDASRVLWTIDDNEGTTRWLLDNAAGVASQYSYSPYGQPTAGDTSLTPFLYAGGLYDALTGLQYNSAVRRRPLVRPRPRPLAPARSNRAFWRGLQRSTLCRQRSDQLR